MNSARKAKNVSPSTGGNLEVSETVLYSGSKVRLRHLKYVELTLLGINIFNFILLVHKNGNIEQFYA